jgi:hypothetical protein
VAVAIATAIRVLMGTVGLRGSLAEYYFWLGVDTLIACVFIVQSYLAQPKDVLPVFDGVLPPPRNTTPPNAWNWPGPMTTPYEVPAA